jgi:hypothetical protein
VLAARGRIGRLSTATPGADSLAFANAQVAAWEKQWGSAKPEIFELTGSVGRARPGLWPDAVILSPGRQLTSQV